MADLTPRQVIANVMGNFEDNGLNEPLALSMADDILHALKVGGYEVVPIRLSAQERLLADVKAMIEEAGIKQVHIAQKLGISQKHLSHLLTGRSTLSVHWVEQIASVCGHSLDIRLGQEADRD